MQLPTVAPGQQYGQGVQQQALSQAMSPTVNAGSPAPPLPPGLAPGSLGALTRPTERPDEPVTAGAPMGAGPNQIPGLPTAAPPRDPIGASIADLYHALISLDDNPSIVDAQFARMLRLGFDQNE